MAVGRLPCSGDARALLRPSDGLQAKSADLSGAVFTLQISCCGLNEDVGEKSKPSSGIMAISGTATINIREQQLRAQ